MFGPFYEAPKRISLDTTVRLGIGHRSVGVHDEGYNEAIQTQNFSKNEDEDLKWER